MSQPVRHTTLDGVTSTGPGEKTKTKAHDKLGMYVRVEGASTPPDGSNFEIRMETSGDGVHFAPLKYRAPTEDDAYFLTGDDLAQSSENTEVYVGYIGSNSYVTEYLRGNLITNSNNYTVTMFINMSGWTQRGSYLGSREENRDFDQPSRKND